MILNKRTRLNHFSPLEENKMDFNILYLQLPSQVFKSMCVCVCMFERAHTSVYTREYSFCLLSEEEKSTSPAGLVNAVTS